MYVAIALWPNCLFSHSKYLDSSLLLFPLCVEIIYSNQWLIKCFEHTSEKKEIKNLFILGGSYFLLLHSRISSFFSYIQKRIYFYLYNHMLG